jgi:hypothetical protein
MTMNNLKKAFNMQRWNAINRRNIDWHLTFEEWLDIWIKSGKLDQRGKGQGKYCMARHFDLGPYSISNVSIIPDSKNTSDAWKGRKRSKANIAIKSQQAKQQFSKQVICPYCQYTGNGPVMQRWHFDYCKFK